LQACVRAVSLPFRKMTDQFAARCHKRGLRVMTYSCNSPKQVEKASNMGIDVIMTDDPAKVCPYISQQR
ncbi:MAG: glycerophosphodiester phosphodiesterase, partial [Thermodesulfobacteriota bacterium]